jgi:pimeloyl-ACP methyl ester carboxylesterase
MNPNFLEDSSHESGGAPRRSLLQFVGHLLWRLVRPVFRLLTFDPLRRVKHFRNEEGTPTSRFVRAVLYRLAFVPIFIAALACGIVWVSTHPRTVVAELDPASQGIYYDAVTFVSTDQTPIDGWLMPVIDARTVLEQKEQVLRQKHPAVVLLHDIGQRRDALLPLVKPLHEAGYLVLAINLRGGGARAVKGETFGLTELGDVKAAVDMLRRRPFVDGNHIALVGCGSGATAALLAADADAQIAGVVADRPIRDVDELVKVRLLPQNVKVGWIGPLCKWTFELAYGVDAEEVSLTNFRKLFESRRVLMLDPGRAYADVSDPRTIEQIKVFLSAALRMPASSGQPVAGVK